MRLVGNFCARVVWRLMGKINPVLDVREPPSTTQTTKVSSSKRRGKRIA
jgi:hypothetical protein